MVLAFSSLPAQPVPYDALEVRIYNQSGTPDSGVSLMGTGNGYSDINSGWWGTGFSMYYTNGAGATVNLRNVLSPQNTGYVSSVILTNLPAGSDTNGSFRQMYVDYVASGLLIFGLTTNAYTATNSPGYLQANDNPGGWAGVTWQQAELSYTGGNIPTAGGGVPGAIVSYDTIDVTAINQVGIPLLLQLMTNTATPGVVSNGTKGFTNTNNIQAMLSYLNAIPGAPWYSSAPNTNVANYVGPSAAAAGGLIMPVCQNTNLTNTAIWAAGWAGATVPTFAPYVKHVFTNPPMLGTNHGTKVFARISGANGINNENRNASGTPSQNAGATTYYYTFDFTLMPNPRATNLYSTPIPFLTNGTVTVIDTYGGGTGVPTTNTFSNLWVQYTPDRGSPSNSWFSSYIYQAPPTYTAPTPGSPLTGYITNWSVNWSNLATQYNFPWNYFVVNIFDTMANHIAYGFAGGFVNSPIPGTYSNTVLGANVTTNVGAMPSYGWWQQTNLYADLQPASPPRWTTPYYSAWGNAIYQCSKLVYSHPISDRVTNLSVSPGLPLQLANSNPNSFLAITLLPAVVTNNAAMPVFSNNANFVPLTNALPLWTNTSQVLTYTNTSANGLTIPAIGGIGSSNALWVAADGLPPGLVFNPSNGTISGTIPAYTAGQYLIRFQAGNSNGVGTAAMAMNVIAPPKNTGLGVIYGPRIVYTNATNPPNFLITVGTAYTPTSPAIQFPASNASFATYNSSNLPPGMFLCTNYSASGMWMPAVYGTNNSSFPGSFSNFPFTIVISNQFGLKTNKVMAVLTNAGGGNTNYAQWTSPNMSGGSYTNGPVYLRLTQNQASVVGSTAPLLTGINVANATLLAASNLPEGVGCWVSNSAGSPPQLQAYLTGTPTQTTWSFTNTNTTVNVTFVLANNFGTNNQVVPFEVFPNPGPPAGTNPPSIQYVGGLAAGGDGSVAQLLWVNQPIPIAMQGGSANFNGGANQNTLWQAQWATSTNLPPGLYFTTLPETNSGFVNAAIYGIPITTNLGSNNMVTFTVTNRYGVLTTNYMIGTMATNTPNPPLIAPYNPGPLANVTSPPVFSGPTTASAGTNENLEWPLDVSNYPSVFGVTNLPPGLGLMAEWDDANLCFNLSVTGRPTTPNIYTSQVTAQNYWGTTTNTYTVTITGAVSQPPQFTWKTNVLVGTQSSNISFPVQLQGARPVSLTNSPALPLKLVLAQDQFSNWLVSGTPSSGGTNTVSLTASNEFGVTTTNLVLRIAWLTPPAPSFLPPYKARGTSGVAFNFQVQATNTTNFSSPNLPAGLSINATNGLISGTNAGPTAVYTSTVFAKGAGGQTNANFTFTMTNTNVAPVFTSTNTATGQVGTNFSFTNTATGTDPITFGAVRLPAGLSLVATSGVITGTPTNAGTNTWTITASNAGGVANQELTLVIEPAAGPVPTSFLPASAIATQGVAFSQQMTASNSPTNWSATGLPTNLTINSNGLITGTPQMNGTNFVILTAVNSNGSGEGYGTLVVRPTVPVFTNTNRVTGKQGTGLSFAVTATSTASLTYSAANLPGNLQINPASGLISSPSVNTNGTFTSTITASNWGTTASTNLVFVIETALPVFTSTNVVTGTQGVALTPFQATVSNGPAAFTETGLTTNYTFTSFGRLTGIPQLAGTSTVTLFASNSLGKTSQNLQLRIAPAPPTPAPVITSPSAVTRTSGVAFSFSVTANNATNFLADSLPSGLGINATNGLISGTHFGRSAVTTSTITVRGAGGQTNQQLRITITNTNLAPIFTSPTNATGRVGVAFFFTNRATGTPTITFGDLGLPSGLGLVPATGVITGTPTAAGTNVWTITASNAGGVTNRLLRLAIAPSNNAPGPVPASLAPSSAIATQGVAFNLQMTASNSPTNWSAAGLFNNLTINSSGLITGTPQTNGTNGVKITAINSNGSGEGTLTLVVRPTVPVFTSTNVARGTQNQPFGFQVAATSGANITYTATGLPTNLTIHAASGLISGTPQTNGTFNASVVASTWGNSATQALRLVISPVSAGPVITSPLTATATQGVAFQYRITATGTPTITYGASPLPSNLAVNANSGLISGIPRTSGTFPIQITASNASGTDLKTLTLTIASDSTRAPVITSPTLVFGRQGTLFTGRYTITASNRPTTFGATGLPPGLGVVAASGVVTGTPSINGTYMATVQASNASGVGATNVRFIIAIP